MDELQKIIEEINKQHKELLVWIFEEVLPYKGNFSSHRYDIDVSTLTEYTDSLWQNRKDIPIEKCYCGAEPLKLFNFIPSYDGEYNEYSLICPKCKIPVSYLTYDNHCITNWNRFINVVKADESGLLRKELDEKEID